MVDHIPLLPYNRETTDRPDHLPVCFIIFDEAQNATRKQVFDVISRADQETKPTAPYSPALSVIKLTV